MLTQIYIDIALLDHTQLNCLISWELFAHFNDVFLFMKMYLNHLWTKNFEIYHAFFIVNTVSTNCLALLSTSAGCLGPVFSWGWNLKGLGKFQFPLLMISVTQHLWNYIHQHGPITAFWLMFSTFFIQQILPCHRPLTHWGWDKMAAIFQPPFSSAFSSMKMYEFLLKFHWSLFLGVQLAIFHHWFR